jgi:ketosteroid isomerase-like protein
MATDDIEILRRCYDVFSRPRGCERSEWLELFHPDAVIDMSRRVINPHIYRGYEGFMQLVKAAYEDGPWARLEIVPTEVVQAPQHVFAGVRISVSGSSSGIEFDIPLYDVWTLREGKVLLMRAAYRDRREALEAAGLPE